MGKAKRDSHKQAFWQRAIGEQRHSGLSVRVFSRREGQSERQRWLIRSRMGAWT